MASLYKRGEVWWSKSYENGRMVRKSLGTADRAEAKRRMKELVDRVPSTLSGARDVPSATWEITAQDLLAYYRAYGTRNPHEAGIRLRQLTKYWRGWKLGDIDSAAILSYVSHQRGAGKAAATINVNLATLRRALRLAYEHGKLARVPVVRTLRPAPPWSGFFEREQFEAVKSALPDDLALVAQLGYTYGWRVRSEVLTLTKAKWTWRPGRCVSSPVGPRTGMPGWCSSRPSSRRISLTSWPECGKWRGTWGSPARGCSRISVVLTVVDGSEILSGCGEGSAKTLVARGC
jgi:hypothetical protein